MLKRTLDALADGQLDKPSFDEETIDLLVDNGIHPYGQFGAGLRRNHLWMAQRAGWDAQRYNQLVQEWNAEREGIIRDYEERHR